MPLSPSPDEKPFVVEDTYLLCPAPVLREVGMYVFAAPVFVGRWGWVCSLCPAVLLGPMWLPGCHPLVFTAFTSPAVLRSTGSTGNYCKGISEQAEGCV